MRIVKNDKVMVISGKSKGVVGKVLNADPKGGKVIVEGANVHKAHIRPRKQGEEGGIVEKPAPIYVSKVMVVCPKCGKPTRIGIKYQDNGDKARVCKKCGATISVISTAKKKGE